MKHAAPRRHRDHLLTHAARKHMEEVDHIGIFWEDSVVVKVDVVARAARSSAQDVEEINDILIFRKNDVAIEVDRVAAILAREGIDRNVSIEAVDAESRKPTRYE